MFSAARLRLFSLVFLGAELVAAHQNTLFTSSVTYCHPPETLLIQQFDVAYFTRNNSVTFNISAANVEKGVNLTANLFLNVYGMKPVNRTINLCNILSGALCPLPVYSFVGADSVTLPPAVNVASLIPSIAYHIPDLEGYAQLTLTEVGTGQIKACVQATISNGWSTRQLAVEWTTSAFTLAALLVAVLASHKPKALLPFRVIELIQIYQAIASSALLDLNYPSVYRSFTLNFAWSLGLFTSTRSSLQAAINRMRNFTGGHLANSSSVAAVGFVNRKLSPYNVDLSATTRSQLLSRNPGSFASVLQVTRRASLSAIGSRTLAASDEVGSGVTTVTDSSDNVLQAGVPIYVNTIHISTANAFVTVFLCFLIMFVIAAVLLGAGYCVSRLINSGQAKTVLETPKEYLWYALGWMLRLGLMVHFPLLLFIFYQWTLHDSWLSIFLSVIALLAISGLVLYPACATLGVARRYSAVSLYHHPSSVLSSYGPLYAHYTSHRYFFFLVPLTATHLRAVFISLVKLNAIAQLVLLIALEIGVVVAHLWIRPAVRRRSDVLSSGIAIARLLCTCMLVAFAQNLTVRPIPRVVVGIVIAVVYLLALVTLLVDVAKHVVLYVWAQIRPQRATDLSMTESPTDFDSATEAEMDKRSSQIQDEEKMYTPSLLSTQDRAPQAYHSQPALQPQESGCHFHALSLSSSEPSAGNSMRRDYGTASTMGPLLPHLWSVETSSPPGFVPRNSYTGQRVLAVLHPGSEGPESFMSMHGVAI